MSMVQGRTGRDRQADALSRVWGMGALLALMLVFTLGCRRSTPVMPESPPDAIETVVEALGDNRPEVLWEALPPSYQADLRELIGTFCAHMDADIYDRAFRILGKAVRVLGEQKEFVFNSPLALSTPLLESIMGSQWNDTVGLLNAISKSDISSIESLRQMDPGQFLASTGSKVMSDLNRLRSRAQRSPGPNPWEVVGKALKEARIDFVPGDGGQGQLIWTSTKDDSIQEVALTQVEGRWVPSEMAASWEAKVAEAKVNLTKLNSEEAKKAKPMITSVLTTLEGAMDALLQAKTQQQFDQTLGGLTAIGAMLRIMRASR